MALTTGALGDISCDQNTPAAPVVQVIAIRVLSQGCGRCPNCRFRLTVSDGIHIHRVVVPGGGLTRQLADGAIEVYSTLRLDSYHLDAVGAYGRTAIVLQEATVLARDVDHRLGRPDQLTVDAHDGLTLLMLAAQGEVPEGVQPLLAAGVDPNRATSKGITALMFAAARGCNQTVTLLLAYGAAPTIRGQPASAVARRGGWQDTARLLDWSAARSPFEIAARGNMDGEMQAMLGTGRLAVPQGLAEKIRLLQSLPHGVARSALLPWSPERHMLFHPGVRDAVRVVLRVAARIPNPVPFELWLMVCSFFTRAGWPPP